MDEQAKKLVQNLQSHDLAETLRLRRARWAQEAGLPPEAFALPFPGNTIMVQRTPSLTGPLSICLALATGLATAAAVAPWLLRTANATPPATKTEVENVELEVRWKLGPDGQWQTTVEPVKK